MKKGLSVLLIAAALFGFYGGAVNLNDVLACKDYWEAESEKTTADLNKLEDGLNELSDNEEAYLDGLDQVADGEEALIDGEADYADGQAELAKGEADYAAAPGKLADARKQLAAGEAALEDGKAKLAAGKAKLKAGKKSLSDLEKLIKGLKKAKTSFNDYSIGDDGSKGTAWKNGFEHKASKAALAKIAAGEKASDSPGLEQARDVITSTVKAKKSTLNAAGALGGVDGLADSILKAGSYKTFNNALKSGVKPLLTAAATLDTLSKTVSGTVAAKKESLTQAATLIGNKAARDKQIDDLKTTKSGLEAQLNAIKDLPDAATLPSGDTVKASKEKLENGIAQCDGGIDKLSDTMNLKKEVAADIGAALSKLGTDKLAMVESLDKSIYDDLQTDLAVLTLNSKAQALWSDDATFAKYIGTFATDMGRLADKLTESAKEARSTSATFKDWNNGYSQLKDGQDQLASTTEGIPYAFSQMLSNSTIRKALKKNAAALIPVLEKYKGSTLANDDMDDFDADMKIVSGAIEKALPVLYGIKSTGQKDYAKGQKDLAKGKKDLAAGKAKLAAGRAEYAKGLAAYKAAPGKLASGRAALADGLEKLMKGRADLAAGKDKLAEYEDGEQQVRDGLATLAASEANGGLTSILDRLGGDDNFDGIDGHLQLGEGLDAVEVGRGYQADSGVLITKEITKRAIGTAAGLAAAAVALLAGLLSLFRKNKGAGVCAILTAAAGAAGIAYGSSAGMEFSNIAGSHAGSVAWIAFGVLAAVAAVHAIVHFAAKETK